MTLTFISSRESTRKKFFMNSTYIMSRKWESKVFGLSRAKWLLHPSVRAKVGIQRFWAQEAEMTLTFISSRESTRKKFFMNSTYIMSRKWESKVFGLSRAKWLLHPSVRANQRENNFFWTRGTSCLESGNQSFLGSVGRNDSNTHQFAGIGEKKLFMNSTYIMSRKWESKVFGLRTPKWL